MMLKSCVLPVPAPWVFHLSLCPWRGELQPADPTDWQIKQREEKQFSLNTACVPEARHTSWLILCLIKHLFVLKCLTPVLFTPSCVRLLLLLVAQVCFMAHCVQHAVMLSRIAGKHGRKKSSWNIELTPRWRKSGYSISYRIIYGVTLISRMMQLINQ